MINLRQWFQDQGIDFDWAQQTAEQLKTQYPHLCEALKAYKDVLGELEAIVLVVETMNKKFPPRRLPAQE